MKESRRKVCDLNQPKHARAYLTELETMGKLEFDEPITVAELTDEQCVIAAEMCFMKLSPVERKTLQ